MHKLTVTLEQHTPLLHFQPTQEGATLRASEIKPRFDKFIFSELGSGNIKNGIEIAKQKGWVIGQPGHEALGYKMKINPKDKINYNLNVVNQLNNNQQQFNEIGQKLYTTTLYPNIMSNIGGKTVDNITNFSFYKEVCITIQCINEELCSYLKEKKNKFFNKRNFGNRTSKGFGSFTVKNSDLFVPDYQLIFRIDTFNKKDSILYKNLFSLIEKIWGKLKKNNKNNDDERSVLLGEKIGNDWERIPSPIFFKPIIDKYSDYWDIQLQIFFNEDLFNNTNLVKKEFVKKIDKFIEEYNDDIRNTQEIFENILNTRIIEGEYEDELLIIE